MTYERCMCGADDCPRCRPYGTLFNDLEPDDPPDEPERLSPEQLWDRADWIKDQTKESK